MFSHYTIKNHFGYPQWLPHTTCGRLKNGPPSPNPQKLYVTLYGKRDFVNEIKGPEMRRLSWIMQLPPLLSQIIYKEEGGWERKM